MHGRMRSFVLILSALAPRKPKIYFRRWRFRCNNKNEKKRPRKANYSLGIPFSDSSTIEERFSHSLSVVCILLELIWIRVSYSKRLLHKKWFDNNDILFLFSFSLLFFTLFSVRCELENCPRDNGPTYSHWAPSWVEWIQSKWCHYYTRRPSFNFMRATF